jgi:succinate dehydrogenase / fumarate reductase cytochrome b subunit
MSGIESLRSSLSYRGGVGQWAWLLHRLAGVGVLLFLILHILDIFLVAFGPELFEKLLFIYHSVVFRPLLVLLVFGVVYHALNGLRIIILDFWPATTVHHKQMWYGAISISLGLTFISIVAMF